MPFNALQRITSFQPHSPKGKGKERLDLVIFPTSALIIDTEDDLHTTSSRSSFSSTASSSSSVTLDEVMLQNVALDERELSFVVKASEGSLYLRGGTYFLLSRATSIEGEVYTYLGPNGHKLQTRLSPSETPIKCLLHNHRPAFVTTQQDSRRSATLCMSNERWSRKNAQVICAACGATLRAKRV